MTYREEDGDDESNAVDSPKCKSPWTCMNHETRNIKWRQINCSYYFTFLWCVCLFVFFSCSWFSIVSHVRCCIWCWCHYCKNLLLFLLRWIFQTNTILLLFSLLLLLLVYHNVFMFYKNNVINIMNRGGKATESLKLNKWANEKSKPQFQWCDKRWNNHHHHRHRRRWHHHHYYQHHR